jgi:hypothetical protein
VTSDGWHPVDQLCKGWLDLARQYGIAVEDQDGELLPEVLDATSHTVSAATWFGLTRRLPEANRQVQHSPQAPARLAPGLAALRSLPEDGARNTGLVDSESQQSNLYSNIVDYVDIMEWARLQGSHPQTAYQWCREGTLPVSRALP